MYVDRYLQKANMPVRFASRLPAGAFSCLSFVPPLQKNKNKYACMHACLSFQVSPAGSSPAPPSGVQPESPSAPSGVQPESPSPGTASKAASPVFQKRALPKFLYRAMKHDGTDLLPAGEPIDMGGDCSLRVQVCRCILGGSHFTSPFLHASSDPQLALY